MNYVSRIVIILLLPAFGFAGSGFVINGKITGVISGYVSIIAKDTSAAKDIVAPRVRISNGAFVFSGRVDHPQLVELKISTQTIYLFLENTNYTITGRFDSLASESIKGGTLNDQWCDYIASRQLPFDYLKAHPHIELAFWLAAQCTRSFEESSAAYEMLGAQEKSTPEGRSLLERIERYRKISPGSPVPSFSLTDVDGNAFSISDLKGKIVVLDFWASWCAPCRAYIPTVREHYLRYKEKGVAFVGVSVDDDKQKWTEALGDLHMEWMQALATGGFSESNGVRKLFNINGIPYMVVVNKEGRIAATLDFYKKDQLENVLQQLTQ